MALNRVLQHLDAGEHIGLETVYRYQAALREQLSQLEGEIKQLQSQAPQLQDVCTQQLQAELLAVETGTYAELIRAGQLNSQLPPLLPEVFNGHNSAS